MNNLRAAALVRPMLLARKKYWLSGALIAQGGLIVALMELLTL